MFRSILFAFLMIFMPLSKSYSQNDLGDSLKTELAKCKTAPDSVGILSNLAWYISESNRPEAIYFGKMALKKAKGITDSSLIADAYDAAALAFRLEGNHEQAEKLYQKSLDIGIRNHIDVKIAWINYNLANMSVEAGHLDDAIKYAKRSFSHFMKMGNIKNASEAFWLLIDIHPDVYTDSLINAFTEYLPSETDETNRLFIYLEITNLYNLKGNRNKAMQYVQLAMELAEKHKNTAATVKVYYKIAEYFQNVQRNYSMALVYYEKIYELCRLLKDADLSQIYLELGEMHRLTGNDSLALHYFNLALENGEKINHRHTMALAYQRLGDVCYSGKKYEDALHYYLRCYETNCDVCPKIKFHDALINIGNVYLFSGNTEPAQKFYTRSLEIADSANNSRAQTHSWQAFAALYEKQGFLEKAIRYNLKALEIAMQGNYLEGQYFNADKLSSLYAGLFNHEKAYKYLSQANLLKDSIDKNNEIDNLAQLETYFDFKNLQVQRELEHTKSNEEIHRQKLLRNFLIVGSILLALTVTMFHFGYRRKKKANKLLNEQKQAIEKMSQQIHEADQAKLEFYTNVSHELKTPLTLILGMTEKSDEYNDKSVSIVRKSAFKLLKLINHLLDLRKIDTSKMELCVKQENINEFIKDILGSFDNFVHQKNIAVVFRETPDPMVYYDHDKLEKIVSNLVSNAIKYTGNQGIINVELKKNNDGYVEINIIDNGIGMADTEIKNIFERFYRIHGNDNQGSGIGLALVKELVKLHRGEIRVTSKKNQGSSFSVIIPSEKRHYNEKDLNDHAEADSNWNYLDVSELESENIDEKESDAPDPLKKTLLIVEDNTDLRKFIADIFIAEYEVIEAHDGIDGLTKSRRYVPDIIISDIMMPNLNGLQMIDKLKKDMATSHIPIILLTAKSDIDTHISSFDKGVDDFISKPFDSAILKSRVENLLKLRKQLVEKFSKEFQLQPREIVIEDADQKFLQKAIEIIEKNIANPSLNVELLAFELGVSRTQLYRKLNALTDYPPKNFIRIIRLKRAAQILKQGQNNIAEVMDATGFSNYSYFNNCFRDFFGKYPKDFGIVSMKGNLN